MSVQLGCASQEYRRVETFWCSDEEWCQLCHDNLVYDADLLSSEVLKRQVIKMGGGCVSISGLLAPISLPDVKMREKWMLNI